MVPNTGLTKREYFVPKLICSMKNGSNPIAYIGTMEKQPVNLGLTKREYFAGLAMQGLVAREGWSERIMEEGGDKSLCIYIAAASIKMADELLKQLEQ